MANNPVDLFENTFCDAFSFMFFGNHIRYFLFCVVMSFLLPPVSVAQNLEDGAYTQLNWKEGPIEGTGELEFAEDRGHATCGDLYPSDSFYLTDVPRGATVKVDLSAHIGKPLPASYPVFGLKIFEKYDGADSMETNMLFQKDNVDAEGDEEEIVEVTTKHKGAVWIGIYGSEPYPCRKVKPPYNGHYRLNVRVDPSSKTGKNGKPGRVLWSYQTDHWVLGAPEVKNGTVYATSMDGYLYALDKKTGQREWLFDTGAEIWNQSPVLENGLVFVSAYDDGRLFAVDAETGEQKWSFNTKDDRDSPPYPAAENGVVYIGVEGELTVEGFQSSLYALDAETGNTLWSKETKRIVEDAIAVQNGYVYIGLNPVHQSVDRGVMALDADTGEEEWFFSTMQDDPNRLTVSGNSLYVGGYKDDQQLYAVNAQTGNLKWKFKTMGAVKGAPVVSDDIVYVGSEDNHIYAVSKHSGKEIWSFETDDEVTTSGAVHRGILYMGSHDGKLYALDAERGQYKWAFTTSELMGTPTISDGIIYVGSGGNYKIHALATESYGVEEKSKKNSEGMPEIPSKLEEEHPKNGKPVIKANQVKKDSPHAVFGVSWMAVAKGVELSSVQFTLSQAGEVVDTGSRSISGFEASGTVTLKHKFARGSGRTYQIKMTVTNQRGQTATATTSVRESASLITKAGGTSETASNAGQEDKNTSNRTDNGTPDTTTASPTKQEAGSLPTKVAKKIRGTAMIKTEEGWEELKKYDTVPEDAVISTGFESALFLDDADKGIRKIGALKQGKAGELGKYLENLDLYMDPKNAKIHIKKKQIRADFDVTTPQMTSAVRG